VDTARLEGTLDGVPFTFDASDEDLEDFGIGANNDLNIFAVHGYYDFGSYDLGGVSGGVRPYLGLGIGAATVENMSTEFALLVTAGANFAIGPQAYLGARYRFGWISGPEDDNFGIQWSDFTTHTFSIVLGYRFGRMSCADHAVNDRFWVQNRSNITDPSLPDRSS
jgi:hypothetical protein